MDTSQVREKSIKIKENIEKVLVGKSEVIDLILTAFFAEGNVLLEDVPGTGKTILSKSLSKSIDADFKRIQFTPDLLPSDVTGLNYYNQKEGEFVFREGPVFTNIILADEINRATPRTQSSLLECMEEKQVTIDGDTYKMNNPFFVIATQNPIETIGTFPLPEAQLDRFMMKLKVGFPDSNEEIKMIERFIKNNPLEEISSVINKEEIEEIKKCVKEVFVHPHLMKYIVEIINKTRQNDNISVGVSPRGSILLTKASQSFAAIKGRNYVLPDDIKYLAPFVLSHRIVTRNSYDSDNKSEQFINSILEDVEVPTENFKKL